MILIICYKNKNYFNSKFSEINKPKSYRNVYALIDYEPKKRQDKLYRYVNSLIV